MGVTRVTAAYRHIVETLISAVGAREGKYVDRTDLPDDENGNTPSATARLSLPNLPANSN